MKNIFSFLFYFCFVCGAVAQNYNVPQFTVNNRTYKCKSLKYDIIIRNQANQSQTSVGGVKDVGSACDFQWISKNRKLLTQNIKALFSTTRYEQLKALKTRVYIGVYAPRNSGVIQEVAFSVLKNCALTYQEFYAIEDVVKGMDLLIPVPDCSFQYINSEAIFVFD